MHPKHCKTVLGGMSIFWPPSFLIFPWAISINIWFAPNRKISEIKWMKWKREIFKPYMEIAAFLPSEQPWDGNLDHFEGKDRIEYQDLTQQQFPWPANTKNIPTTYSCFLDHQVSQVKYYSKRSSRLMKNAKELVKKMEMQDPSLDEVLWGQITFRQNGQLYPLMINHELRR